MSEKLILKVTHREHTGRSASHRVRKSNQIPAILYGKHSDPKTLAVDAPGFARLHKLVAGRALIIELEGAAQGKNALSFLQEVQRDPITDQFLHVDFREVKADEKVDVNVPVVVVGEAYGVKNQNGVLEVAVHTVRVRCLPKDLPPSIEVDVTDLKSGELIKVGTLKPIEGVEFRDSAGQPVVSCLAPEEEETPAATAAAPAAGTAAAPAASAPAKK